MTIPITIPARPAWLPKLPPVLTPSNKAPILFSGVPFLLGDNPQIVDILRAPAQSFASDTESDRGGDSVVEAAEKGGEGLWAGSQLGVVTGFQTRTGGRVLWTGGVSVFSDEFADAVFESVHNSVLFVRFILTNGFGAQSVEANNLETLSLSRTSRRGRSRRISFSVSTLQHITSPLTRTRLSEHFIQ